METISALHPQVHRVHHFARIGHQSQAHALIQSAREIERLNAQPELKRVEYKVG